MTIVFLHTGTSHRGLGTVSKVTLYVNDNISSSQKGTYICCNHKSTSLLHFLRVNGPHCIQEQVSQIHLYLVILLKQEISHGTTLLFKYHRSACGDLELGILVAW